MFQEETEGQLRLQDWNESRPSRKQGAGDRLRLVRE